MISKISKEFFPVNEIQLFILSENLRSGTKITPLPTPKIHKKIMSIEYFKLKIIRLQKDELIRVFMLERF